jgi:hypothetical protein
LTALEVEVLIGQLFPPLQNNKAMAAQMQTMAKFSDAMLHQEGHVLSSIEFMHSDYKGG